MNLLRSFRLLAALAAALLTSCTTVSVTTDSDPQTNFANYRTYALSPTPVLGSRPLPPSSFATLQSTLDSGLAAKGFRKSSKPSFVIAHHIAARNRTEVFMIPNWNNYSGYGLGYYGNWSGYFPAQPMISRFTEGTLILDFVDTATRRLIWRGTAVGIVGSQKENEKSIAKSVKRMLEHFPPKH